MVRPFALRPRPVPGWLESRNSLPSVCTRRRAHSVSWAALLSDIAPNPMTTNPLILAPSGMPCRCSTDDLFCQVMPTSTKITIATLNRRKVEGQRIAMLTCYDCPTAELMCAAGIDVLLVGDTYAEVVLGHNSTLPATVDMMLEVTRAVRRGAPEAYLIGDMPYLSYQAENTAAVRNAGRFMAEAGCDAVKIEVDRQLLDTVTAMTRASIPVVAHLGLRPQSVHRIGGYRSQGKTAEQARMLIEDARAMESVGVSMLLLEAVPAEIARMITEATTLPVIGCASGPHCDGTVVVLHDMLGYNAGHPPSSVKPYLDIHTLLVNAFTRFKTDIEGRAFPADEHGIRISDSELQKLRRDLDSGS